MANNSQCRLHSHTMPHWTMVFLCFMLFVLLKDNSHKWIFDNQTLIYSWFCDKIYNILFVISLLIPIRAEPNRTKPKPYPYHGHIMSHTPGKRYERLRSFSCQCAHRLTVYFFLLESITPGYSNNVSVIGYAEMPSKIQ